MIISIIEKYTSRLNVGVKQGKVAQSGKRKDRNRVELEKFKSSQNTLAILNI